MDTAQVYMMRGVIEKALQACGALNTAAKKKYFIDFMVQICASSYLSGLVTSAGCELDMQTIAWYAEKHQAPFTRDELENAYNIILDNSTHGLGGTTDK